MLLYITSINAVYKVCFTFRSVSDDRAFIVLGIMPTDILADEMTSIYNVKSTSSLSQTKIGEGGRHTNWERMGKGLVTYRLIAVIKEWLKRRSGEINYSLTYGREANLVR